MYMYMYGDTSSTITLCTYYKPTAYNYKNKFNTFNILYVYMHTDLGVAYYNYAVKNPLTSK